MPAKVAVVGAGVIGLSAALRLLEEHPDGSIEVTIVARDFPAPAETFFLDPAAHINYTSPWAGAHNRWVLWVADGSEAAAAAERDHGFALATFRHMQSIVARFPEAGVTFVPAIEYLETPGPEYTQLADEALQKQLGLHDADLDLGFRVLSKDGASSGGKADSAADAPFPAGVTWGCTYRTWCVNPMVYCSFLLRRFVAAGGKVARRDLRTPHELFAPPPAAAATAAGTPLPPPPPLPDKTLGAPAGGFDLVVNCSGNGFGDDPHMFITRGQTCLVRNACDATVTRQNADGSWTFSVPRNFDGGTIIGGTKEPGNWDASPSLANREKLLANFAATYPKVLEGSKRGRFEVLADVVGRRPTRRGGMRLEAEEVAAASSGRAKKHVIVHAYGVGGRGYEISWGVAGAVAELVKKNL
ncbi:FAD dependent oxidoreductase superfamily [Sporothrix brasiliensis 5110]|uniref:FAD dependent oxidoreductase superfamily n=1 Tax=Sporothrix brasiliensis 5110 TaxID=1398154 RepID=A0A0C2ET43_9PEZI|nr:FAD dependent oxidoreductase superfamily [Sporothrix brasiliensis 5110]KIH89574.1 FAD dependent oxidoreductase superfamily [Sporothrix brasiliensis 5110]